MSAIPITAEQTGLVIAFKNPELIADKVLPVVKGLSEKNSFKWFERNLSDGLTVPDTKVGRRSLLNEAEFGGADRSATAEAFGLRVAIPQEDIDEAAGVVDNLVSQRLQESIYLTLLDREVRAAKMAQDANNYLPGNVHAIAAADKFGAATSDPIKLLLAKLDSGIVRPNRMILSQKVWNALRTNPKVVSAVFPTATSGVVGREALADILELSEIVVGKAYINASKKGKEASVSRIWGDNVMLHYDDGIATATTGLAWGRTVEIGDRFARIDEDLNMGLKGGFWAKAGFYHADVVLAKGAGILLTGAV